MPGRLWLSTCQGAHLPPSAMYDGYKAQRKGMPPELAQQLPVLKELLADLGYAGGGAADGL